MAGDASSASVTLSYGSNGAGGYGGEIVSVRLLSLPPPLADFDLPETPGGAWLDVVPPGGSEPAFRLPLPDPRIGREAASDAGLERLAAKKGERHSTSFEIPWYGTGTRIILRLGNGEQLDSRARAGAFSLTLEPDESRGNQYPAAVAIPRWGHVNPRAIRLVVLGEAFAASEQAAFDTAVDACLDALEKVEPLSRLLSALAPMKLLLPSKVSGISDKPRDTPFRARWRSADAQERVILVDESKVAQVLAHVAQRSSAQAVVIANSRRYGGSGGASTVVSCDPLSMQGVMVHELGHSLFRLADEYSAASGYSNDGNPTLPNVSGPFAPGKLKWGDLVYPGTPLPTPSMPPYPAVGAFEGAMYRDHLCYRPSFTCRMRDLAADFCPVCTREIERRLTPHL